jgi:adenosine deaminase
MNQSERYAHILKLEQRNHKAKSKAAFDKSERERFQDKINQLSSIHSMWSSSIFGAMLGGLK